MKNKWFMIIGTIVLMMAMMIGCDTEGNDSSESSDSSGPSTPPPIHYTITFDKNGGTGTMFDLSADGGEEITLPACAFTAPTYMRFNYWNTDKNDSNSSTRYNAGAKVKDLTTDNGAVVTLYAQWIEKDAHNIIYLNTKNAVIANNDKQFLESQDVTLPTITADGYTFGGWSLVTDDVTADVTIAGWNKGEKTADVTLWARMTALSYTVTLSNDADDNSGDASVTATYDAKLPTLTANPSKIGCTFGGYWTQANGQGVQYINANGEGSKEWDIAENTTLYVKWTANTYTIKFNANGGTGTDIADLSMTYDVAANLPANAFDRTGYTFAGWNTAANGLGTTYANGASVNNLTDVSGDTVNLYAKWTANTYTIKFNANGGTGTDIADLSMTYDVSADLPVNTFTKANNIFKGWTSSADGEVVYNDGQNVKNLTADNEAEITLYAVWSNTGILANGNMLINGVEYANTSFVKVMDSQVTVTGSDDNWTGYLDSSASAKFKGVFIKNRNVKISPYSMSKYLVTQELYEAVMSSGKNYDYNSTEEGKHPVYYVNWYDAITFCNKLSILMGKDPCYSVKIDDNEIDWQNLVYGDIPASSSAANINSWKAAACDITKNGYRLPTEAEWEFAARGGDPSQADWKYAFSGIDVESGNKIYYGNSYLSTDANLATVGWYKGNSSSKAHAVGSKTANRLGIYDMSGNLNEWCWDWYEDITTGTDDNPLTVENPLGAGFVSGRVSRGGFWDGFAGGSSVSLRYNGTDLYSRSSYYGFRLACSGE